MKRSVLALALLCIVAACGGGGGGGSPVPSGNQPSVKMGKASFTIVVPKSAQSASRMHLPKYIVPGTQSVSIQVISVDGATPDPLPAPVVAQIGPNAPGCSTVSSGVSCTITVPVPYAKSLILQISSFASTDGSGTPLAVGDLGPIDSTQPNPTPFPVALGGYVSTLVVTPLSANPTISSSGVQTFTFTVTPKDASGNAILPPGGYEPTISITASNDTSGAITFSDATLTTPPSNGINTVTMTFDPSKGYSGSSLITVSAATSPTPVTSSMFFTRGNLTVGPRVLEFSLPAGSASKPWQITTGPDDASLWFTENGADKFGAIPTTCVTSSTCTVVEGSIPQTTSPTGIVSGPNGIVWFGGTNSSPTGHLWNVQTGTTCSSSTLAGCVVTQQPDPINSPSIYDMKMTTGNLIGMGMSSSKSGYYGQIFPLAQPTPSYLAQGGSGAQVFGIASNGFATDPADDAIVQLGCGDCGSYNFFSFQASGNPQGILSSSTGYNYVADAANSQIVSFSSLSCSSTCSYTPVGTKTAGAHPEFLAFGSDGNIYFTEFQANKIGVLNVTNLLSPTMSSEIPIPTANAGPWGITLGPDGNIWFTEYNIGKIGVVVP